MSSDESDVHQVRALLEGAGLVEREDRYRVVISGADALDYLHRMLTQDVARVAVGCATYACLLTPKGRILGDLWIWNQGETLLLEMDEQARAAVMPVLEKYVIADDVHFAPEAPPVRRWALAGPMAADTLRRAGLPTPDVGCFETTTPADSPVTVLHATRRGLPTFELVASPEAAGVIEQLAATVCAQAALDDAFTHLGIPRFGRELGDDVLFNEAGLEEAVAWGKGCYPGQEPVIMAKHRGHPPRVLVRLALFDAPQAGRGTGLLQGDKRVGELTSVAPCLDTIPGAVALAYVRFAVAEAGDALELEGGGRAEFVEP